MANTKMSALTAAAALTGTELAHLVQSGSNVQSTAQAIGARGFRLLGTWDLSVNTLDSGNEIVLDLDGVKGIIVDAQGPTFGTSDAIDMRVSDDGGTTYFSGASDYEEYHLRNGGQNADLSRTAIRVTVGGTTSCAGYHLFTGFNDSTVNPSGMGMFSSTTPYFARARLQVAAGAVDYVKFYSNAGNPATGGNLNVYGIG